MESKDTDRKNRESLSPIFLASQHDDPFASSPNPIATGDPSESTLSLFFLKICRLIKRVGFAFVYLSLLIILIPFLYYFVLWGISTIRLVFER